VSAIGDETHSEQIAAAQPKVVPAKLDNLEEAHSAVVAAIQLGRYDKAVESYKRLLEIDPQLQCGFSELSLRSDSVLKTSLEVGREEVERVLGDMPVLRSHITKDDAIHQWLVTCFSGRDSCNSIIWNKSDPEGRFDATHQHPTPQQAAELRIRQQRTRLTLFGVPIRTAATHDEVWFSLVFEIYNSQNYRRFNELRELSRRGVLARDSFIAEVIRTELDAELKTKAFYVYEFYPLMRTRNVHSDPSMWRLHAPLTHAERIMACRALEPAWDTYGREYDNIVGTKGANKPK
jgi:tetratricopeptide (TPR) repeat protein